MAMTPGERLAELRHLGAGGEAGEELLGYTENRFALPGGAPPLPLADEPFAGCWQGYAADAAERGAAAVLRERLVQLRFPVRAGMSSDAGYLAATRRGAPALDEGAPLRDPEGVALFMHPTAAGRIPVVLVADRGDFELLVQALTRRNEPEPVPSSMGACMVAGYVNWNRVHAVRAHWEREHGAAGWDAAFAALRERKELYQDRFLLASSGPYSGVPAARLGMEHEEWLRLSRVIRVEHECVHYFTRRVFGSMRNALHDELMADYAGIVAAAGEYRADWFLHFLGLEDADRYREGGRLENYRGTPPLSGDAFAALQPLVRNAAHELEALDYDLGERCRGMLGQARMMTLLASHTLEELAAPGAAEALLRAWNAAEAGAREPAMAAGGRIRGSGWGAGAEKALSPLVTSLPLPQ